MHAKLIGTYKGKIVFPKSITVQTVYHLDNVILKDDFDNNQIKGSCNFFNNKKDCTDFIIVGQYYLTNNLSDNINILTKKEIQLMNSLKEGDVIVFDADICVDDSYLFHDVYSYFSIIKNIEKYDDKRAADKIKSIVSEMQLKPYII